MRRFTAQIEPRWRITTFFLLMINHNANITIQERTENFAIRVIKAYSELTKRPFDELWPSLIKAIFEKWNINRCQLFIS